MRTLRSATAFFCSSGHRRCVSRRIPWTSADVLMVNIFQFFLGLLKMERLNCTSRMYIYIFSMHVGSGVGYISFLDVPAVRLLCTN